MCLLHDIIANGDTMKKLIYICLSALLLSGCTTKKESLQKYDFTSTSLGFDTVIMFSAYAESEKQFNEYKQIVIDEFTYYDQLFDKYDTHKDVANIKTINDAAGDHAVTVEQPIMDVLTLAKEFDEASNHQFSITLGSVLNLWHDAREQSLDDPNKAYIPSKQDLQEANKHTGWQHIEIDEKNRKVFITDKETQLDVGAVAKGYAVEEVAKKLEQAGLKHGLINGGGNVRLIGSKPNDEAWSVGLQIPNVQTMQTNSLLSIQIASSCSFVTSGDYQRYYTYNDERMHHIIDPSTLYPSKHARSVTVITKDSALADLLSTTLFTMSYDDGVDFIKRVQEQKQISIEAIWVYDEGKAETSNTITKDGYDLAFTDGVIDMIKQ